MVPSIRTTLLLGKDVRKVRTPLRERRRRKPFGLRREQAKQSVELLVLHRLYLQV